MNMDERKIQELEAENAELKKQLQKLTEENDFLKKFDRIYQVAIGMTTNTVSVVDIANKSLNQIVNEGDYVGIVPSMTNAPESIIETGIIYPDDCEKYRRFFREIYSGEPTAECTMRVLEENRGWVWFTMYSQTMYKDDGTPEIAVVFSDDVTARKRAEMQYQEYRNMVTSEADFVWEANITKDEMLVESEMTDRFFAQAHFKEYSAIANAAAAVIPEEYKESVVQTFSKEGLKHAYDRARREVVLEYPFHVAGGDETIWLQSTAYLLTNYEGDLCAIICSRDITEKKRKEDELRRLAQRDPLTGLYNRRVFEKKVKSKLEERSNETPQLLIIDIDNFKQINDKFGHAAGDDVIIQIAHSLGKHFRRDDLISRVGGDEYMVFLHNMIPSELLEKKIGSLRSSLRNLKISAGTYLDVSLSIGNAVYGEGDSFEEMYKHADKALYDAKKNGKNQMVDF